MTLQEAIAAAARTLQAAGVDSPRFDAEELAAHVLRVRRGQLPLTVATDNQLSELASLVERRATREPLQHITGSVGFRYLDIPVGAGVFIPRPETETVVQAGIDALRNNPAPVVVDLCAGSGAIALSLAGELPRSTVHAVELDPTAFAWLQRNIETLGLEVHATHGDAGDALPDLDGTVDLVISNPPYVEDDVEVSPEVAHDPALALWGGGEDGLEVVRVVLARARKLLCPQGFLVVEHSERQGASTRQAATEAGFIDATTHQDLAGRDRFLTARQPGTR